MPTCLLAIVAYFFCPDSPGTARFFTAREKEVAVLLAHSQPGDYQHEGLQLRQLFAAFKDYRSKPLPPSLPSPVISPLQALIKITRLNRRLLHRSDKLWLQRLFRQSATIPTNDHLPNGHLYSPTGERDDGTPILAMLLDNSGRDGAVRPSATARAVRGCRRRRRCSRIPCVGVRDRNGAALFRDFPGGQYLCRCWGHF